MPSRRSGAFPTRVTHVDFLSADAHKWLLGPLAIGIVFVRKEHFELLRPTLLGAWNVQCPNFVTQDEIRFVPTAQRYEPGVLNAAGVYGMKAAIELINRFGIDVIAARLLELRAHLIAQIGTARLPPSLGPHEPSAATAITTVRHDRTDSAKLFAALEKARVIASLRHDREGRNYLRFSPHFYNTEAELDRVVEVLRSAL
jgi:selenocysteine lyase/cysteine desulfurase